MLRKIKILVQARMGSTRLPGKVLAPIMKKPLLHYLVERLNRVTESDGVVILTTNEIADHAIVDFCKREGVAYFRGSEEDVLERYYLAAKEQDLDVIVRITSDCPLADPKLIDKVIRYFLENDKKWDYASTCYEKRTFPRGLDVEIFTFDALREAFDKAKDPAEREHVTLYMYRNPQEFRIVNIESQINLSKYRLTVDTAEDLELIRRVYEELYPRNQNFNLQDVIQLLENHPEWQLINAHIKQKDV